MMSSPRIDVLIARLEKGLNKSLEVFNTLSDEAWTQCIYEDPACWTMRDLLAHFVSSEENLLLMAQDVAGGGKGSPAGFDYDAFNAEEQTRLQHVSPEALVADLQQARQATLTWLRTLEESQLDCIGNHPALGEVTLETMITAIYGHQLLHMREAKSKLEKNSN